MESESSEDLDAKKGLKVSLGPWEAHAWIDTRIENAKQAWQFSGVRFAIWGWNSDKAMP
jgi:hypothetical protein